MNKEHEFFAALQYNMQNAMADAASKNQDMAVGLDISIADLAYHVGSSFASVVYNFADCDKDSLQRITEAVIAALQEGFTDKADLLVADSEDLIRFEAVPTGTTIN